MATLPRITAIDTDTGSGGIRVVRRRVGSDRRVGSARRVGSPYG